MGTAKEQFKSKLAEIVALTEQEDAFAWISTEFEGLIEDLYHIRDILRIDIAQGLTAAREVPVLGVVEGVPEAPVAPKEAAQIPKPKKGKSVAAEPTTE